MVNPELRSQLPSGEDDIFTKMAELFIDCLDKLEGATKVLEFINNSQNYKESHRATINDLQMRYLEIIKEYQEQLFSQPVPEEEGQE